MRAGKDSLEAFPQGDPARIPEPFDREPPSRERTLGVSLILPSPIPEKEE